MVHILENAKGENPHLRISFDPGSEYCQSATTAIKNAIQITDYLFLNWTEMGQLAGYEEVLLLKKRKISEKEVASEISKLCQGPKLMIVLKSYNSTRFFQPFKDSVLVRRYWQVPLLPLSVRDDTGAGDIFAAGFIAAHLIPALSFDMRTAISFSSRLVKEN